MKLLFGLELECILIKSDTFIQNLINIINVDFKNNSMFLIKKKNTTKKLVDPNFLRNVIKILHTNKDSDMIELIKLTKKLLTDEYDIRIFINYILCKNTTKDLSINMVANESIVKFENCNQDKKFNWTIDYDSTVDGFDNDSYYTNITNYNIKSENIISRICIWYNRYT